MFGTIIQNVYSKTGVSDIIEALDELCSPDDSYGWASAGIYSFWDYETKEILYIGLAVNLSKRFQQHNGIIKMDENGCKYKKIEEYFSKKDKLGYSVFLQSPLHQPVTADNFTSWFKYNPDEVTLKSLNNEQPKSDLKRVEGILIESFKRKHGKLPKWNNVGGSIAGQLRASDGNYAIVEAFSTPQYSVLVSRCTLKELSTSPTYTQYESILHTIRTYMLIFGMTFENALTLVCKFDPLNTFDRILYSNYLQKELNPLK
ncbi:hypothetical protein BFZC1_15520 [Lysinibacillus fusiformis ZC1]|nr:hypothetical protein BFZC1_15520 [Lysinibacillus fusiformis ZC1]